MTKDSGLQVPSNRSTRSRIGLVGVLAQCNGCNKNYCCSRGGWSRADMEWDSRLYWPDTLTTLAAAAAKTSIICLGTSIVPTCPCHPLVLAQQAMSLYDIAPSRLRL